MPKLPMPDLTRLTDDDIEEYMARSIADSEALIAETDACLRPASILGCRGR